MSGETHTTTGVDQSQVQDQIDRSRVEQDEETDKKISESEQRTRKELDDRLNPVEKQAKDNGKAIDNLKTEVKDVEQRTTQAIAENRKHLLKELNASEKRQSKKVDELRDEVNDLDRKQTDRLNKEIKDRVAGEKGINDRINQVDDRLDDVDETLENQQEQIDRQRSEYKELIQKQRDRFNQQLADEREARQQQIASINAKLEAAELTQEKQKQFATAFFQDVKSVLIAAESNLQKDANRFTPGKIAEFKQRLQSCGSLAANGMWQSIAAITQEVYSEFCDLRLTLAYQKDEWVLRKAAAIESLDKLTILADGYRRSAIAVSTEVGEVKADFNADRWTKGEITAFESKVKSLKGQVADEGLTPVALAEIEKTIESLDCELQAIVDKGKAAFFASQYRVQMGTQVVTGLEQFGYRVVDEENDAVFEGGDDREAFVVKLRGPGNDAIVAVIAPQEGSNLLSLNTFSSALVDEESARQNAEAVAEALSEIGIAVGEMKCEEKPREEYRDLNAVKTRSPQVQTQAAQSIEV